MYELIFITPTKIVTSNNKAVLKMHSLASKMLWSEGNRRDTSDLFLRWCISINDKNILAHVLGIFYEKKRFL